jgi:gliding motility-associated-like protein
MARTDFELEEWNLRLYNRWGELVWESNDVNAQWDGTFKGEISPDGLYHYEVKLISCGNENKYQNWSGFVLLIR